MVRTALLLILALSPVGAAGAACIGLSTPVSAPVGDGFAPTGTYSGHWGIDYDTESSQVVRAAAAGRVSFSGIVAGNRTVTVDHGGGLKSSYSYLAEAWVGRGASVSMGSALGTSGLLHGLATPGLHFSARIDGIYVDPATLLGCPAFAIPAALRLVPAE